MKILSFILLSISLNLNASAFHCLKDGKYRFIYQDNPIEVKANYCMNHASYNIISQNCLSEKLCLAKKRYQHITHKKIVANNFGNPSHYRCKYLGGEPILIEYMLKNNQWKPGGICLFKDNSFVDVENTL